MSSAERRDLTNLGLRKGKKRLRQSLDASFDLGTALAPRIHKVKTSKGQTPQGKVGRALGGRKKR